jgi:preprotein translocase subunit SecY
MDHRTLAQQTQRGSKPLVAVQRAAAVAMAAMQAAPMLVLVGQQRL